MWNNSQFLIFLCISDHNKLLELKRKLEFREMMYRMTSMGGDIIIYYPKSSLWLSPYAVGPPNESSRKRSNIEATITGRTCSWKEERV